MGTEEGCAIHTLLYALHHIKINKIMVKDNQKMVMLKNKDVSPTRLRMLTLTQLRAARAIVGWTRADLQNAAALLFRPSPGLNCRELLQNQYVTKAAACAGGCRG